MAFFAFSPILRSPTPPGAPPASVSPGQRSSAPASRPGVGVAVSGEAAARGSRQPSAPPASRAREARWQREGPAVPLGPRRPRLAAATGPKGEAVRLDHGLSDPNRANSPHDAAVVVRTGLLNAEFTYRRSDGFCQLKIDARALVSPSSSHKHSQHRPFRSMHVLDVPSTGGTGVRQKNGGEHKRSKHRVQ